MSLFRKKPKKPDFSGVESSTSTIIEKPAPGSVQTTPPARAKKADFGDVQSSVRSTEQALGGGGGIQPVHMHTVLKGESLSLIAQTHYGKASKWTVIFEANRDTIDDPDRIFPGQVIKVPPLDD